MAGMSTPSTASDLTERLHEQLHWHWATHARPRLDGLSDDELIWEPVPQCWNVRQRGTGSAPIQVGAGEMVMDYAMPEPDPPPVTTIAWRLAHLVVGVFGGRVHSHFGGPPYAYDSFEYAATADVALAQLDEAYGAWSAGVRGLDAEALQRPVGPAEGGWAEAPMIDLVLHINREAIHHLAEVALLRDLYLRRG